MPIFELISKYEGQDSTVNLFPRRKTKGSAGYDFFVAEDTVIEPYEDLCAKLFNSYLDLTDNKIVPLELDNAAALTKNTKCKPTLVPTGVKAKMLNDEYLELSVRSSCPLKHWLILANSVGIIDSDYYNNPDNEGHIYFQFINLAPFPILLKKGDCIGQGIFHKYIKTAQDCVEEAKTRRGGFGSTDASKVIYGK